jgi:hypothetical protein
MTGYDDDWDDDEPLHPDEILAHTDLVALDERRGTGLGPTLRESGVSCGRPLVYAVPREDLPGPLRARAAAGHRYYGLLLAFDLDELPKGQRYTAARFEIRLADPRGAAVALHGDGGALGLLYGLGAPLPVSPTAIQTVAAAGPRWGLLGRLSPRSGQARARTFGLQRSEFGWTYDNAGAHQLIRDSYGMHALVELPADATELAGTFSIQAEIARSMLGFEQRRRASIDEVVAFREPLAALTNAASMHRAVRLCMAADVAGFSQQPIDMAERTQQRLLQVLAQARRQAGIEESAVDPQEQGDGQFTVLPIGIDESRVIPGLVQGLRRALTETNRDLGDLARLRLRVALHRGLMNPGDNGWVGTATIAVHRILDSPPVRDALREHTAADFVLGVPDVLFRDVIMHSYEPPRPDEFAEITVDLPAKKFVENAWLYVPPPGS